MFTKIGPEFQYLDGYDQNSNVSKERGRNPVLERIRSEYQCLQKWRQYSNVRKDKVRIPMLGGIPMFKTRDRILVLGRIKSEHQSL